MKSQQLERRKMIIMDKNKQFEMIQKFANTMKSKKHGISNIYIFESTDEHGNVTDVKYGMNLMTNTGFNAIYKSGSSFELSDTVHLYVGSGVSQFDKTTSYIETPLFGGLAATNETTTKDYQFPIIYSKGLQADTGIITLISSFGKVSYPTNISNYDTDTLITEYGIGTNHNSLWTHSHIYNDRGEMSQITKKKNEKLTIYIYMCLSLYEHVIMNSWSNNVFPIITTPAIMFNRMFETNLMTYKRGNVRVVRNTGVQHTWDDTSGTNIVNTTTSGSFTLWNQEGSEHGYIDGFIYDSPGISIISPETLSQPESFVLTAFTSDDITKSSGFSDKIGKNITDASTYNANQYPPFSSMTDLEVYTFNYHTGEWDNPCPFSNDDNMSYTNVGLETGYYKTMYYWSNGQIQTAYLYQNIDTTNPILSVNQGHEMLIACDKYWDQDTWITITNFNNIPVEARNCRYWISSSNALSIVPTRSTTPFVLLDSPGGTNGYQTFPASVFNLNKGSIYQSATNTGYNCITVGRQICALNRQRSYTIGPSDASFYDIDLMSYGKWLFLFDTSNDGTIYTIDVSGLNDNTPDISVLSVKKSLGFSGNVNSYNQIYRSTNGNGLFTFQSLNTSVKETVIMKVTDSTISVETHPWVRACCLHGTTKIAYITATDGSTIHLYDTTYAADIGTITLPSGYTVAAMFGNADHLWFYDGNTAAYHVDISNSSYTLDSCNSMYITSLADSYRIKASYVNDVTMVYDSRSNDKTMSHVFYITHDNPTNIRNMSPFDSNPSIIDLGIFNCEIKYLNGHTLVAVINMAGLYYRQWGAMYICDLGRYIRTNTVYKRFISAYNTGLGMYLYGEYLFYNNGQYLFPAVNSIPITVKGKTKTITTFNHTKSISNKAFNVSFTNNPLWGYDINNGKPPGHPAPILNANGQIIGWS